MVAADVSGRLSRAERQEAEFLCKYEGNGVSVVELDEEAKRNSWSSAEFAALIKRRRNPTDHPHGRANTGALQLTNQRTPFSGDMPNYGDDSQEVFDLLIVDIFPRGTYPPNKASLSQRRLLGHQSTKHLRPTTTPDASSASHSPVQRVSAPICSTNDGGLVTM
ncbi:hypothetical protein B0H17DRAFT_1134422 [Mycena rosella]|uniref:Uncharacterized protein n=1 Tax=Mycena rosella TaxID=1033263 RepID=A0AAD7DIJ4_MYCRO|nr:hypothetical protein B0H17DRAFT_1134422 [Mycena rosella]